MKKSVLSLFILSAVLFSSTVQAQENCTPTPPDGLNELAAFSLFQGNYNSKDYPFALKMGRWILCKKPMTLEGFPGFKLTTQLDRFSIIYSEIAGSQSDPAIKTAYLDSALYVLDLKQELFGEDPDIQYDVHQKKGRFFLENYNFIQGGIGKAYDQFQEMFDLDPEKTTKLGNGYYVEVLLNDRVSKRMKEEAQAIIDKAKPYANPKTLDFINDKQKDLLGSPQEQIAYYNVILTAEPDNLEALKIVANAYDQLGDNEKYIAAKRKIYELEPTFRSAIELANIERGNGEYDQAEIHYKEALNLASTDEEKIDANVRLSDVYADTDRLEISKRYIQEAIKLNPNSGTPYIKLASLYGKAVNACTADRKLQAEDKIVYWVVLDYLNKAKQVDPSVSNTVNSQLSTYEQVTPTAVDKFLTLNIQNGDKIKVDRTLMPCYGWINETTTVR